MHLIAFFSIGAPLQVLCNMEKETCLLSLKLGKEMENSYKRDVDNEDNLDSKDFKNLFSVNNLCKN